MLNSILQKSHLPAIPVTWLWFAANNITLKLDFAKWWPNCNHLHILSVKSKLAPHKIMQNVHPGDSSMHNSMPENFTTCSNNKNHLLSTPAPDLSQSKSQTYCTQLQSLRCLQIQGNGIFWNQTKKIVARQRSIITELIKNQDSLCFNSKLFLNSICGKPQIIQVC